MVLGWAHLEAQQSSFGPDAGEPSETVLTPAWWSCSQASEKLNFGIEYRQEQSSKKGIKISRIVRRNGMAEKGLKLNNGKEHTFEKHYSEIPFVPILYKYFDMQISQYSYDENSLMK